MTPEQMHLVFGWGAVVCFFGLVLNLGMIKKRGKSAKLMGVAFALLGLGLILVYQGIPLAYASPLGVAAMAVLFYDATVRLDNPSRKDGGAR
jgi:hypothetical protein